MKVLVPHYYKDFKCKANLCRNSCCTGWEIDVDGNTLLKYQSLNTDFGEKILSNIKAENGCFSFRLTASERCPFLNSRNLCDIILTLGEDYICDICREHPRFRHFYSDREEIGLGICCEKACEIVLCDDKPFSLVTLSDGVEDLSEEEAEFIAERDGILDKISECGCVREASEYVRKIYGTEEIFIEDGETASFLLSLEMLDNSWKDKVNLLKAERKFTADTAAEKAFLNLYKYFIFRYFSDAGIYEAIVFSEISVKIIRSVCERTGFNIENICEVAAMYSSEIEYSDENVNKIIEFARR